VNHLGVYQKIQGDLAEGGFFLHVSAISKDNLKKYMLGTFLFGKHISLYILPILKLRYFM
jgi:hypothetical protein